MTESPYQTIKRSIAAGIASGQYITGQTLPSEHDLCRMFGVSRMTVNRAMRELAAERLVRRVPGLGSFVAEPAIQSELLELRNIADEIGARGHRHRAEVFDLESIVPVAATAMAFGCSPGASLFRSVILHCENDRPIQLEDRLVNPLLAPDYLVQDFAAMTPNFYLTVVVPADRVEHAVEAIAAQAEIATALWLEPGAPCLLVTRRTWCAGTLASLARLYHPGESYRLTGGFNPGLSQ